MSDVEWLAAAIDLATGSVREGGGPFGAVVVADGVAVGTGQNRVTRVPNGAQPFDTWLATADRVAY